MARFEVEQAHGQRPLDSDGPSDQPRSDGGLRWVAARPRPAAIEPLAPARYRVQFTASAELRDKLERLQALMRSSIPDGDLAAVEERDEGRCRYVDAQGHRCTARAWLQFHHRRTWVLGGDHSPGNVSLLCRVHNRLMAEIDYGTNAVGKHRRSNARDYASGSR